MSIKRVFLVTAAMMLGAVGLLAVGIGFGLALSFWPAQTAGLVIGGMLIGTIIDLRREYRNERKVS